jgi:DNA replication initiation complex subunit (GINS family)
MLPVSYKPPLSAVLYNKFQISPRLAINFKSQTFSKKWGVMDNIKITLETLYDILRNEKKREELQKLEDTFFIDVVSYLREKRSLLKEKKTDEDLFAAGEKDKIEYELRSIKRILKEIYEKREKKIIDIAVNKSRTGSDIIDTSCMLREEKEFYEKVLTTLNSSRRNVLLKLFKGELPGLFEDATPKEFLKKIVKENETNDETDHRLNLKEKNKSEEIRKKIEVGENKSNKDESIEQNIEQKTKVKFIHPMPSFVWKDMKVYGPYNQGDEIEIFPEVADLLVRKKRAEKV